MRKMTGGDNNAYSLQYTLNIIIEYELKINKRFYDETIDDSFSSLPADQELNEVKMDILNDMDIVERNSISDDPKQIFESISKSLEEQHDSSHDFMLVVFKIISKVMDEEISKVESGVQYNIQAMSFYMNVIRPKIIEKFESFYEKIENKMFWNKYKYLLLKDILNNIYDNRLLINEDFCNTYILQSWNEIKLFRPYSEIEAINKQISYILNNLLRTDADEILTSLNEKLQAKADIPSTIVQDLIFSIFMNASCNRSKQMYKLMQQINKIFKNIRDDVYKYQITAIYCQYLKNTYNLQFANNITNSSDLTQLQTFETDCLQVMKDKLGITQDTTLEECDKLCESYQMEYELVNVLLIYSLKESNLVNDINTMILKDNVDLIELNIHFPNKECQAEIVQTTMKNNKLCLKQLYASQKKECSTQKMKIIYILEYVINTVERYIVFRINDQTYKLTIEWIETDRFNVKLYDSKNIQIYSVDNLIHHDTPYYQHEFEKE